jgi:hypothetical protein
LARMLPLAGMRAHQLSIFRLGKATDLRACRLSSAPARLGQRHSRVEADAGPAEVVVDDQPHLGGQPVDELLTGFGPPGQPSHD